MYNAFGDTSDDYQGDWANLPLAYQKSTGVQTPIEKSDKNDELIAVMKSVRSLLLKKGG